MKYFIVAATLSAVSYAQVNIASATDCNSLTVQCLDLPDPNNPACNDSWDKCNLCHADYAACQMPGTDFTISQDACDSQLMLCVTSAFPQLPGAPEAGSETPASPITTTTAAPSATHSMTSGECQTVYYQCLLGGKKQELCQCDLTTCNGEDNARSRASCSSASIAATATSTPTCFYGWTQETGSSKASVVDAERKSTSHKDKSATGGVASNAVNLLGLAAALVAPLII